MRTSPRTGPWAWPPSSPSGTYSPSPYNSRTKASGAGSSCATCTAAATRSTTHHATDQGAGATCASAATEQRRAPSANGNAASAGELAPAANQRVEPVAHRDNRLPIDDPMKVLHGLSHDAHPALHGGTSNVG